MYVQGGNYLLETSATYEVITEAEVEIVNFKKSAGMSTACYSEALWKTALRYETQYNEAGLKEILIEGLHCSTHYYMHTYCRAHKDANFLSFGYHTTSLVKLQEGTKIPSPSSPGKTGSRPKLSK